MIQLDIIDYSNNHVEIAFSGQLSVNRLYRNAKGRTKPYIQAKHIVYNSLQKKYSDVIEYEFDKYNQYECEYTFIFNNKSRRDVSNYIKFFEDLVFRLLIKDDDSKVVKITLQKSVYRNLKYNYLIMKWKDTNEDLLTKDKNLYSRLSSLPEKYLKK